MKTSTAVGFSCTDSFRRAYKEPVSKSTIAGSHDVIVTHRKKHLLEIHNCFGKLASRQMGTPISYQVRHSHVCPSLAATTTLVSPACDRFSGCKLTRGEKEPSIHKPPPRRSALDTGHWCTKWDRNLGKILRQPLDDLTDIRLDAAFELNQWRLFEPLRHAEHLLATSNTLLRTNTSSMGPRWLPVLMK